MASSIYQTEGIESTHPAIEGHANDRGAMSLKPKRGRPRIDAQVETAAEVRRVCCFWLLSEIRFHLFACEQPFLIQDR